MKAIRVASFCTLIGVCALLSPVSANQSEITPKEAGELAQAAADTYHSGLSANLIAHRFAPDFYDFEILSDNRVGSPHIARFAVNVNTGDVWDGSGYCHRITSPRIREIQRRIRAIFHLAGRAYLDFHKRKPMCDAD
jgi:hypothetical protein